MPGLSSFTLQGVLDITNIAFFMLYSAREARPSCCKWSLHHYQARWHSPAKQVFGNNITTYQSFTLSRLFSHSIRHNKNQKHRKKAFIFKLRRALRSTKVQWRPIPIGLGVGFLGIFQFYRIQRKDDRTYAAHKDDRRINNDPFAEGGKNASKTGPL